MFAPTGLPSRGRLGAAALGGASAVLAAWGAALACVDGGMAAGWPVGAAVGVTGLVTGLGWAWLRACCRRAALHQSHLARTLDTLLGNLPGMAYRGRNEPAWPMAFVGAACEAVTGYTPADLQEGGLVRYGDLIAPEDRERVWSTVQQAVQAGQSYELTYRIRTRGGEQKWVWERGRSVPTAEGGPPVLEGVICDVTNLRRAEDALHHSRQRLDLQVALMPMGLLVTDAELRITEWNPAAERIFGYDRASALGREVVDLLVAEDLRPVLTPFIRELIADRQPRITVNENRTRAGRTILCEWHGVPLFDDAGQFAGLMGMVQDITDRRAADRAVRASEQRHRQLFTEMLDAFAVHEIVCDPAGRAVDYRFVEVNPAFERLTGLRAEEVCGQSARAILPHLDPWWIETYGRVALTGQPAHFERLEPALGKHFEVAAYQTAPGQFAAVFTDITERCRAQQALAEERAFLRRIIDALPAFVCVKDIEGRFELVNRALADAFGTTVEAMTGRTDAAFLSDPDEVRAFRRDDLEVITTRAGKLVTEEPITYADGRLHWHMTSKVPLLDEDGNCRRLLAVSTDISALKQVESALQERDHLLAKILATAPVAIGLVRRGRLVWVNDEACRISGYTREALGDGAGHGLAPEGWAAQLGRLHEGLQATGTAAFEHPLRHPDGRLVRLQVQAAALDPRRVEDGVIFAGLDVTARYAAEAQLRLQGAALAAAANQIVITDREARIVWVNPAFEAQTGYALADLLGQTPRVIKSPRTPPAVHADLWATIAAGRTWSGAMVDRRRDGSEYELELTVAPVRDPGGAITHYVGIQNDITQRRQRERELEAISAVSLSLRDAPTRAQMPPVILGQAMAVTGADGAALYTFGAERGAAVAELAQGTLAGLSGQRVALQDGPWTRVIQDRQPFLSADMAAEPHPLCPELWAAAPAGLGVPLLVRETLIGVLWLARRQPFLDRDVRRVTAVADIAANALQRAGLHEQTDRQLQRLGALRAIELALTSSVDLRVTLQILLSQMTRQPRLDAAAILLHRPAGHVLEFAAGHGLRSADATRRCLVLGRGVLGQAALERRTVSEPRLAEAPADLAADPFLCAEGAVMYLGLPLVAKGQLKGWFELLHRGPLVLDPQWQEFLEAVGGQAAIAIDNAELVRDLQASNSELTLAYDATIEGWSRALDLRDSTTEGHSQRVAELTLQLAQAVGVHDDELVGIRRGALLHDIGKMGIPDAILRKPGPLTDEEWAAMREHPVLAYRMLEPIAFLHSALDIPYCHHERWDGGGYPRGLRATEIPLAARLFAVVDVWDALCSDRPYRAAWNRERVVEHLASLRGTHFDPDVLAAFLALPAIH